MARADSGWHRKPNNAASRARAREYASRRHRELRTAWKRRIDGGEVVRCWRPSCRRVLVPGMWQLGHDDYDRRVIRGPECTNCNRHHAAVAGAIAANAKRQRFPRAQSRRW